MSSITKEKPKNFYHSSGPGFKEQLEAIFRRYRAGKSAAELLKSGEYDTGAIYVPSYCLAVSPHVKGRTKRSRIEPLFYPYDFLNDTDKVYWEPGKTLIKWKLPKLHDTDIEGSYSITVGNVQRKAKKAQYSLKKGNDTSWSENIKIGLSVHQNDLDFEKIPDNVTLELKSKEEIESLLKILEQDMHYVRNKLFPELTKQWAEDIVKKIPIPEDLRETWTKEDSLQEMNTILLDGLDKFSSSKRPRTTWTKWIMLYGKRGVQRKIDALTHESHDVNRVLRFASHHPDVKDPEVLRKLWVVKYELTELKKNYPYLSEAELTAMINVNVDKCSISIENFRKAIEGSESKLKKISISTPVTSESEGYTLADKIPSKQTVEHIYEDSKDIENFVSDLLNGSGISFHKVLSDVERTATGFKIDAKTKQILFSPWLLEGEEWTNKIDKNRAITRAYSDFTVNGSLKSPEAIKNIWANKKIKYNKKTVLEEAHAGISDSMKQAILKSKISFNKGLYVLAMTGFLGKPGLHDPILVPALQDILKNYEHNKLSYEEMISKAKTDSYKPEIFYVPALYNLTFQGFEIILKSPLDLKITEKTLNALGAIGEGTYTQEHFKLTKFRKIIQQFIEIEKEVDEQYLISIQKHLRKVMVKNETRH